MADPVSLSLIAATSIATTAASAGVGAYGQLYQGRAQSGMYNYQAGIAQMNQRIAQQDADYARQAGEVEAQETGMRGRAQFGLTKAAIGAGNIDISSGSAKQVLGSETAITQQNEAVVRANAAKRAYGFEVTAAEDTAQGGLYRSAASTSTTAADIGAFGTILGGVGSVSSKWLQASQAGIFSNADIGGGVNPDSAYGQQVYSNSIYR